MSIIGLMLKMAGKDGLKLDERIGAGYLAGQCWKYGWMMVRGFLLGVFYGNISNRVFIGSRVKIVRKKYLRAGHGCRLEDRVSIHALSEKGVVLGDHVLIGRGTRIECTGSLENLGRGISIGNRSTFSNDCFFGAAGGIEIGEDVVAGQFIRFHSENHDFDDRNVLIRKQGVSHKGIKVGNNCWIGSGVVFLDGARLGDGCVVGANAVVSKEFPDNCVIAGVPAKILRYRGLGWDE